MILTPEQQEEFDKFNDKYHWKDKWESFPNPEKNGYLNAPVGPGVYQIRTVDDHNYIICGESGETLYRMLSLLPKPFRKGIRDNKEKKEFVSQNIDKIEYRTLACDSKANAKKIQDELLGFEIHKYNT